MTTTTTILYHSYDAGPCPDGHWAAWVAKKRYPEAEVVPVVYGAPCPNIESDLIVIVDFSFPATQINKWVEQGKKVILIDHHKTALNDLSVFIGAVTPPERAIIFDLTESGATLTWKTFFPNEPMPPVLGYIKDRDLWEFKLPHSHEIHATLSILPKDFQLYDTLAELNEEELRAALVFLGTVLLKRRRKLVAEIASRHTFEDIADYSDIPTVFLREEEAYLTSDICQSLYLQYPDAPFTCCVTSPGNGVIKYSLRSNKDGNNTDVGAIAKQFGGGGHNNASGYEVTAH